MRQKRIMIVGASAWQVPMICRAKDLGFMVGVVDYNHNAVGIKFADKYYNASTVDPEGVYGATKKFCADGITTVATDMPMRAIAYTCERLGLIGIDFDTAIKATNKAEMIQAFRDKNVPHPWFYVVKVGELDKYKNKLTYPCICKPVDNAASRGVIQVNTKHDIEAAVKYSSSESKARDVIIEQLLVGSEISVEAFAIDGQIYVLAITDKITTGAPYYVEMGHSQPSKFNGHEKEQIEEATADAMKAVGIKNGPAHVEMMVTTNGPILIELGARLGGDFITTDLVPLSTGIDMLGATIQAACGEKVNLESKICKASAIRYKKTGIGSLVSVRGLEEANLIEGVHRAALLKSIGDEVTDIHNSLDRIGYAIAQAGSVKEAFAICDKALRIIDVAVS